MTSVAKPAILVAVVVGAFAPVRGLRAADATTRPAPPLSVSRFLVDRPDERIAVLSNGLTVILKAHRTAPVVAVRMYCRTGSIYEQEFAGAGLSHLF